MILQAPGLAPIAVVVLLPKLEQYLLQEPSHLTHSLAAKRDAHAAENEKDLNLKVSTNGIVGRVTQML